MSCLIHNVCHQLEVSEERGTCAARLSFLIGFCSYCCRALRVALVPTLGKTNPNGE